MRASRRARTISFLKAHAWTIVILLFVGFAVAAVVLYSLAEFHEEISETWVRSLDRICMNFLHAHTSRPLTAVMLALSFIGSVQGILSGLAIAALWRWRKRDVREAVLLVAAVGGSAALNVGLKLHFHRRRPDVPWALTQEHGFSFPSGHSVAAITLYGVLAYLLIGHLKGTLARSTLLVIAAVLIVGIGVSRVYLGVHYPSDVAAGYLAGMIWLSSVIACDWKLLEALKKSSAKETFAEGEGSERTSHES